MEFAFYVMLIVWLISVIAMIVIGMQLLASTQKERMELLKLIKADSLSEYSSFDQSRPKTNTENNFVRQAMRNAYNKRDDDEDDGN